jgi:hypothetical protein
MTLMLRRPSTIAWLHATARCRPIKRGLTDHRGKIRKGKLRVERLAGAFLKDAQDGTVVGNGIVSAGVAN